MCGYLAGSTYTCLAIALERYLGICHAQSDFVIRRSRYYVICILIAAIIVDSPRFLEIRTVYDNDGNPVDFTYTDLR